MLEDCILKLSNSRYRKLGRPATLAATKPDTCVKILNKSAYYVIKDCAEITLKYLPHFIYSGIRDPITKMKGVVSESNIVDFATRASREDHTQQLLRLILDDISRKHVVEVNVAPVESNSEIDFTLTGDEDDVYGDYDYASLEVIPESSDAEPTLSVTNITDVDSVIDVLKQSLLA